jgi:hypothetical protein
LMFIHAHEVRLPGGKAREEMMRPVSPEQWQQRAVATQTAQATGTARGQVCANQAWLGPQEPYACRCMSLSQRDKPGSMCAMGATAPPSRQAAPTRWGAAVPAPGRPHQPGGGMIGRPRPWMIDHAVATGNQHHGVTERMMLQICRVLFSEFS